MRCIVLFLAAIISATPATAQQAQGFAWQQADGTPAPPNPAQAAKDGFGAMILVTSDYDAFWKAWESPTPPSVKTTEQITRGKPIQAMLLFAACKAGADGNCNVTVEFSMTGPDGKPYGDVMKSAAWSGQPAPGYNLQLSPASLGFKLDPKDALGTYIFAAKVTDEVAGTTVALRQPVTAVEMK